MSRDIKEIPIAEIEVGPFRIRLKEPNANDLAESIAESGLLEPVGVVKVGNKKYQLIYGERRLIACKALGWQEIPAQIFADANQALLAAVAENVQRENLNPIEEAAAYRRLLKTGMKQAQLGKAIGKSQSYIAQKLRLEKLPLGVTTLVGLGYFTEGHLRQILRLEKIVKKGLGNRPPEGYEDIFAGMFRAGHHVGIRDMVTYYQDKVAWGELPCTVVELKERIDRIAKHWGVKE